MTAQRSGRSDGHYVAEGAVSPGVLRFHHGLLRWQDRLSLGQDGEMVSPTSGPDSERRLRRAASAALSRQVPEPRDDEAADDSTKDDSTKDDDSAAAQRLEHQTLWVDIQVRRAIERGDFDNLPGAGKPIRGLGATHDPDWWVKSLIEREKITGVLPPALALRKEDAGFQSVLDAQVTEAAVREHVDDFNRRVVAARRQLLGGPPVVTRTRDVDEEVVAWRARRTERQERLRRQRQQSTATAEPRTRGWWPRWRRREG
jgi:hypothetical protein